MPEIVSEQLDAIDILADHRWHWVPSIPTGNITGGVANQLWLHGTQTNHGHYPRPDDPETVQGFRAEYFTEDDGIPYRGDDIYLSHGEVRLLGRSAAVMVVRWPAPEFLCPDNHDSHIFMRGLHTDEEYNGVGLMDVLYG